MFDIKKFISLESIEFNPVMVEMIIFKNEVPYRSSMLDYVICMQHLWMEIIMTWKEI